MVARQAAAARWNTHMQSWIVLAAAIACEVAGTVFMKLSNSLTRWVWIPPMLFAYILALLGLALALRTIEVGIAYAVWAATGTLLIALVGVVFFGESLSLIKVVAIVLVIAGVVGLNLADSAAHH
jgi:small multidrug resistance pump